MNDHELVNNESENEREASSDDVGVKLNIRHAPGVVAIRIADDMYAFGFEQAKQIAFAILNAATRAEINAELAGENLDLQASIEELQRC